MSDKDFKSQLVDGVLMQTFIASSDTAVDAWSAEVDQHIGASDSAHPFRILVDVSSSQVSFSRHARQTSLDLFNRHRNHRGRMAFLFSNPITPYFGRIFIASFGRMHFEVQFFSSKQTALNWLHQVN